VCDCCFPPFVGFVCNELIRPVTERYHEQALTQDATKKTEARA